MSDFDIKKFKHRKSLRESNQEEILLSIIRSEPLGISRMELVMATKLDPETVSSHCKQLVLNKMITKTNKKAKYHLTDKAYGDKTIRAWRFRKNALSLVGSWKVPLDEENAFCNINENDLTTENHDKLMLFSLANWIGAFIVYTFIDAVRPNKWIPKIKLVDKDKSISDQIRGRSKDKLVEEWIKGIADPIDFFKEFLKLSVVKKGLPLNNPRYRNPSIIMGKMRPEIRTRLLENPRSMKKYQDSIAAHNKRQDEVRKFESDNFKRSLYEMDKTNFAKLIRIFGEVFPHHLTELEQIRNSLEP